MKKLLLLFILAVFTLSLSAQADTYPKVRKKQYFQDSVQFKEPVRFEDNVTFDLGLDAGDTFNQLLDTVPKFVFCAGSGEAGDSVLFARDKHGFGMFNSGNDTTYVVSAELIRISASDSCNFNIYWGNGMTLTAIDSLFNAPEPVGPNQGTLTIDDPEIPPDQDVWMELKAVQITNYAPNEIYIQINTQLKRD